MTALLGTIQEVYFKHLSEDLIGNCAKVLKHFLTREGDISSQAAVIRDAIVKDLLAKLSSCLDCEEEPYDLMACLLRIKRLSLQVDLGDRGQEISEKLLPILLQ